VLNNNSRLSLWVPRNEKRAAHPKPAYPGGSVLGKFFAGADIDHSTATGPGNCQVLAFGSFTSGLAIYYVGQ
jgi:hypothetical protein